MSTDDTVRQLLESAAQRGIDYRKRSPARAVAPSPAAVAAVDGFHEPLPESGTADLAVLEQLDAIGTPATVTMTGPRYFGFVIGGSLPVTVASNWLSTAWDQNVGMHEVTPATATLERVAMNWMIDLFGLPEETSAAFVTGATQ